MNKLVSLTFAALLLARPAGLNTFATPEAVDWPAFLARQDMRWPGLPAKWDTGPFLGNGRLGVIFWQNPAGALHLEVSRGDLYDHRRLPDYGPLFARCRLPNGHFELAVGGANTTGTLRLDLWNAEVRGELKADTQPRQLRVFTHANRDVIVLEVTGPAPALTWHPDPAKSTRQRGIPADLRAYPAPARRQAGDVTVSVQEMPEAVEYHTAGQGAGQYATAWVADSRPDRTVFYISTRITNPGSTAADEAVELVKQARADGIGPLEKSHRAWWHAYYPKSFLSVPDTAIERFYWMQMYKMASASRQGGPMLDLMGPWFMPTSWPGIWWNLNAQLTYWPFYMANHVKEAEPLIETVWNQRSNLALNAAPYQADSCAIGRATGPDCLQSVGSEVGNLPWAMHNLWLHYRSTMDDGFLRDRLFPLMKGNFRYLQHILIKQSDGTLALPKTASPEYTDSVAGGSYTLACVRWLAATLIAADARLKTRDPITADCRAVLATLEPYPIDPATGFMVGKNMPFAKSHRHWSHLFMIYPFHEYTWDNPAQAPLIETSLKHWTSMPERFAGYSWLGAASMYAAGGRGDDALALLQTFLKRSPLPNTLYREGGGPVIETPLAFARTVQELLLTSYGGTLRVFPAVPAVWQDVRFDTFRAEGAFLVSAERHGGRTKWIRIQSLAGEPCRLKTDMPRPQAAGGASLAIQRVADGVYELPLAAGQEILLKPGEK